MKISWNWLHDWIDLDGLTPAQVADRLTMAGLEVDGIEYLGKGSDDIVVARIDRITPHPDADKLVVCALSLAGGASTSVVCGASNMVEGDFVALAQPGSHPPGVDFDIVARKVRGQMSHGMLCSREELGLEGDSDGILILARTHALGTPVFEALGLKDTIIEVDLTPNRPDCLGHMGIARELAALYERPLKAPTGWASAPLWEAASHTPDARPARDAANLTVEDADGCPRYLFAILEDVQVAPSPSWLRSRLTALGLRSINNIVDVTNYILMELNQPLHVFDLDKLEGPEIRVRRAHPGEKMVGIDHNTYELNPADLLIADAHRPVAIAGVMGGEATEVGLETTRVLIECAYFDPTTVRKSARRHSLHTDSSHRFERGIDPAGLPAALARAVDLMLRTQTDLGHTAHLRAGIAETSAAHITDRTTISLPADLANRVLGLTLTHDQVRGYLESLGVVVQTDQGDLWTCSVPTYRPDLARPIDLVEEVARLFGYDQIPTTLPHAAMGYAHRLRAAKPGTDAHPATIVSGQQRRQLQAMRTRLSAWGLFEAVNYGFMSTRALDQLRIPADDHRRQTAVLANPLVAEDALMQTTLIPGLLKNLATNQARRHPDVALFETGRRYFPDQERPTLAILLAGRKLAHWSGEAHWDFYDLKGIIEAVSSDFSIAALRWQSPQPPQPFLHPGVQAQWVNPDGEPIAYLGRLHPGVAAELEVSNDVFVAEIYLDTLFALGHPTKHYTPAPRFPAVQRDFALTYPTDAPYAQLSEAIEQLARQDDTFGRIFESYQLFDVYAGAQVEAGKRSLALSVVYRAADATLNDKQIAAADQRLLDWLKTQVHATIRG